MEEYFKSRLHTANNNLILLECLIPDVNYDTGFCSSLYEIEITEYS